MKNSLIIQFIHLFTQNVLERLFFRKRKRLSAGDGFYFPINLWSKNITDPDIERKQLRS